MAAVYFDYGFVYILVVFTIYGNVIYLKVVNFNSQLKYIYENTGGINILFTVLL